MRTNATAWSQVIYTRRLRWTGHLIRNNENSPVCSAYTESRRKVPMEKIGKKLAWRKLINKDLEKIDISLSLDTANRLLSSDLKYWRRLVVRRSSAMSAIDDHAQI